MEEKNIKVKRTSRVFANTSSDSDQDVFVGSGVESESTIASPTQEEISSGSSRKPKIFSKLFIICVLVVIIILGFIVYCVSGSKSMKLGEVKDNMVSNNGPMTVNGLQVLTQLSKIYPLPANINPMVLPLTDKMISDLRKSDPYYMTLLANAKNGDWLITYPDGSILYDFLANKIVMIGLVKNAPASTTKK